MKYVILHRGELHIRHSIPRSLINAVTIAEASHPKKTLVMVDMHLEEAITKKLCSDGNEQVHKGPMYAGWALTDEELTMLVISNSLTIIDLEQAKYG